MTAPQLAYGRRPPSGAPALALGPLLTGVVPDHPAELDNIAVGGWQVLGNDRYGDCVPVTWANERRLMTRLAGAERYPSLDDVLTLYRVFNPGFPQQDDGCVIQDVLNYLHKTGGPDGVRPVAFAKVDVHNPDELRAAIAVFRVLWFGVVVQRHNVDEFRRGVPWTYDPADADDGGHSIVAGQYDPTQAGVVTWGTEAEFAEGFVDAKLEEAWAVLWPEHFTSPAVRDGLDLAKLAADYQALTGHAVVIPPAPQPAPQPAPEPSSDPDAALAAAARVWLSHRHTSAVNVAFVRNVEQWMTARGYPVP